MNKSIETESLVVNGPQRRLSFWRLFFALFVACGLGYAGFYYMQNRVQQWQIEQVQPVLSPYAPWFAAYVDVTTTPYYSFEKLGATTTPNVVLSFIVASADDSCAPTWGTYYTMDEAASALDLDRRIARLEQQGGKIAVSFGGAFNSELSVSCNDSEKLFDAYKSVIERYGIDTIDLDIERENLQDVDSSLRRAKVIARLQKEYRDNEKDLSVWVTLPVTPQGLTKDGTTVVSHMLSEGVDLSGVNVMTMDYGASKDSSDTMFDASRKALIETHRQLNVLYQQVGIIFSDQSLWRKIGATPMIGQNDVVEEVFVLDDAQKLNAFSLEMGVGRMSMWSANRDVLCGENYVNVKVVSGSCSGVDSPRFAFSQALGDGFDGDIAQSEEIPTAQDLGDNGVVVDDPERSPYQIWQENGVYPKGVKVVWHGNVYEAKWWNKNDLPDHPVLQAWETPWQLVGPVLLNEEPIAQPTLPKGTYPRWDGEVVYDGGDRVLFDGTPFQAKWWTQGDSPAASSSHPDSSPWISLTQAQIVEILEEIESGSE